MTTQSYPEGFSTKAAKQDALDKLNRQYEKARERYMDSVRDKARAEGLDVGEFQAYCISRELPYSLAHVRSTHIEIVAKDGWANTSALINDLVTMRKEVKAIEVTPKPKVTRDDKLRASGEATGHCQICGQLWKTNTGLIPHHGYERPSEGYQTESCFGARHLPYEEDCKVLMGWVAALHYKMEDMLKTREMVQAEQVPVLWTRQVLVKHSWTTQKTLVCRETFEAKRKEAGYSHSTFDALKEYYVRHIDHRIDATLSNIRRQQARIDAWVAPVIAQQAK